MDLPYVLLMDRFKPKASCCQASRGKKNRGGGNLSWEASQGNGGTGDTSTFCFSQLLMCLLLGRVDVRSAPDGPTNWPPTAAISSFQGPCPKAQSLMQRPLLCPTLSSTQSRAKVFSAAKWPQVSRRI